MPDDRRMHRSSALSCLCGLLLSGAAAAQGAADRPSARPCEAAVSEDAIAAISARGELLLASGRTIRLLDMRLPADDAASGRALAWLRSLAGRPVTVAAPAGAADRWNRTAAHVALIDETPPLDVAGRLVDEGLGVVDAGGGRALCRPELLAREARARAGRVGHWAGEEHTPVAVRDLARLQTLVGRFALVEGVVRSVGERRERTYLNFGPDWKTDMTVTIPKRTWAAMQERGLSAAALKGRRVRARGVLEEWQGVAVEVTAADMLEVLGQEVGRP